MDGIRDGNPNPKIRIRPIFFDFEGIRIRNLNCGFGLLIFMTFVAFTKKFYIQILIFKTFVAFSKKFYIQILICCTFFRLG